MSKKNKLKISPLNPLNPLDPINLIKRTVSDSKKLWKSRFNPDMYDSKTGTGWKLVPQWHGDLGWSYMEKFKIKKPGTDAYRALLQVPGKIGETYNTIRDNPMTKQIWDGVNQWMTYIGESEVRRGEMAVEGGKVVKNVVGSTADAIIPDNYYHPECIAEEGGMYTPKECAEFMWEDLNATGFNTDGKK